MKKTEQFITETINSKQINPQYKMDKFSKALRSEKETFLIVNCILLNNNFFQLKLKKTLFY